jgi:hypothetical protein
MLVGRPFRVTDTRWTLRGPRTWQGCSLGGDSVWGGVSRWGESAEHRLSDFAAVSWQNTKAAYERRTEA